MKIEEILNTVIQGDCLEVMKQLPDKCIDLVLTDPPYGTTNQDWDIVPNLEVLWGEIKRICKGNTVMTASQPFTTDLINSNRKEFKYCWVWNKFIQGNFLLAKYQPMKIHEDVCVFGKGIYTPQMRKGKMRMTGGGKSKLWDMEMTKRWNENYYPTSILEIPNTVRGQHPTEKPVTLMSYLVQTYSNPDDIILDCFSGSGSTLVAAKQLGRNYIGIEISEKYCKIANDRLRQDILI